MSQATRTVELDATLTDVNGNPLPNKTIYFYYRPSGTAEWTEIGTATTDSNGTAKTTTQLSPGTYDFRAYFPGDDTYDASEDIVTNVNIAKIPTVLKLKVIVLT